MLLDLYPVFETVKQALIIKDLHPNNTRINAVLSDFSNKASYYIKPAHEITYPIKFLRILASDSVLIVGEYIYRQNEQIARISPNINNSELLESAYSLLSCVQSLALDSSQNFVKQGIQNSHLVKYQTVSREVFF